MNAANKPYEGDALGRQQFAEGLIRMIRWLPKGVIAIDGEWGAGKTWFGERLKTDLDNRGDVTTLWLDAFEADWDDDPAMSLIAGIAEGLTKEDKDEFCSAIGKNLIRVVPAALRVALKWAGNNVGVNEDVVDALADLSKNTSEAWVKKYLEESAERKASLKALKELLSEYVQKDAKKLVIFVDELDRCSPAYAVRFLERLKHLFDLEGVVYVLLWNRQQIQSAVETFYGAGTNGQMYLDKFVDYPLHLSAVGSPRMGDKPFELLINSLVRNLEVGSMPDILYRVDIPAGTRIISSVAVILQLTAREINRLLAWWVMSSTRSLPLLEIWLLGLKVKHPDIFSGLRAHSDAAHKNASTLLSAVSEDQCKDVDTVKKLKWFHAEFFSEKPDPDGYAKYFQSNGGSRSSALTHAIRRLEQDFR